MTKITQAQIERAADIAFEKNKNRIGDNWSWEDGVREHRAPDFLADALKELGIEVEQE